ncbi:hypothetical protein MYK68_11555 [Gordonia sp. PP30]|uniref:hypothetical protein n=1 Tax=Gordonia sp. PP30 TaxID=2935861 RepID=UPI001FFFE88B|nr:hypothetical protein [Gordonia sp. PP30]UQE73401.1 hypothetical protein MYK68_11555 [Gordonia sp. PP30]
MSTAPAATHLRRAWLPIAVTAVVSAVLWAVGPAVSDMQAALAREGAARAGVGLAYWFDWFGGVSPGSYSLIVPTMSAWIGSLPLLCLSTLAIAAMACPLSRRATHPTALAWAVTGAAILNMMSGRVAFAVGAAIALAALLAARRVHPLVGAAGLLVAGLASPLAPAFVGMAAVPFLAYSVTRTASTWAVVAGSAAGVAIPFVLFGAPGSQVFPATTLFWCLAIAACAWAAITEPPAKLIVPLSIAAALLLFFIPTGVGSNIARFFYFVLPCLALYYSRRSPRVLALLLVPALVYALFVAISDLTAAARIDDPATSYTPLAEELARDHGLGNHRVELVDAGTHVGSHMLAGTAKLARGWENQTDARYNPIFYTPDALTADSYRAWLADNAVAYVAVSSKPLRSMQREADLVGGGLPYLTEIWRNSEWTLYRVADPTDIVPAPLTLVSDSPSRMVIDVPKAGVFPIRIRPNRYLTARPEADPATTACITSTDDGWIELHADRPGRYELQGQFSLRGVFTGDTLTCPS